MFALILIYFDAFSFSFNYGLLQLSRKVKKFVCKKKIAKIFISTVLFNFEKC